jgi:hypothetical protein
MQKSDRADMATAPSPAASYLAMLDLARLALERVKERKSEDFLLWLNEDEQARFVGGGHTVIEHTHQVDWASVLRTLMSGKYVLAKEVAAAVDAAVAENILEVPASLWDSKTNSESSPPSREVVLVHGLQALLEPIAAYLQESDGYDLDETLFASVWARYREAWTATDVEWEVIVALGEFLTDGSTLDLGTGITVEPLTAKMKEAIWNASDWVNMGVAIGDFAAAEYCVRGAYREPLAKAATIVGGFRGPVVNEAERFMRAVRLTTGQRIAGIAIRRERRPRVTHELGTVNQRGGTGAWIGGPLPFPAHVPRGLSAAELTAIKGTFDLLSAMQAHLGKLMPCIRRFDQSFERVTAEDALVDLVIVLEGSLLNGIEDELSYRASLRGAALLGQVREPSEVFRLIKAAYDTRSKIVHNGQTLGELAKNGKLGGVAISQFVGAVREVVRAILLRYLRGISDGTSFAELNAAIESQVLATLRQCAIPWAAT